MNTMKPQEQKPTRSLRKAIDAHCRSCIHDPKAGTGNWRQSVMGCTITKCALYHVRPVSKSDAA